MERNPLLENESQQRTMEKLTDIELTSIEVTEAKTRTITSDADSILIQENDIETPYGNIHVAIQGNKSKMAIITYHDIGLNHVSCFQGFFNYDEMQPILRHFCVYHINAPGQDEGAMHLRPQHDALGNPESLGNRFEYPTMDQLAESIQYVVDHYGIKRFIGFGVGAGANVLSRYALNHEHTVDSLVLINPTSTQASWSEWGNQKLSSFYLWRGQMTNFSEEHLLWHWFGSKTRWENNDLITVFKEYVKSINPQNLSLLIESYIKRTDLGISRELDPLKKSEVKQIKCRTLILVGDDAPHVEDAIYMNSRMDPSETDFFKIQDCGGMPLEETPGKVCEAFRLFLQGMGYVPSLRQVHKPTMKTDLHSTRHQPDFSTTTPVC